MAHTIGKVKLKVSPTGFTLTVVVTNPGPPPSTTEEDFDNPPAWVKDATRGNAGCNIDVEHDTETPPAILGVTVW